MATSYPASSVLNQQGLFDEVLKFFLQTPLSRSWAWGAAWTAPTSRRATTSTSSATCEPTPGPTRSPGGSTWVHCVPIQLAKKPLEESLEKPLEISYNGKTPKMGSLDVSQTQIWISSGFSSDFSSCFLDNCLRWVFSTHNGCGRGLI